jgi:uncharacterized protein (TIGR03382 family)
MNRVLVPLLLLSASPALGAIVSVSGQCVQVSPPPVANFPAIMNALAEVWDEQQGVFVSAGVLADITTNPGNSGAPTSGMVTGLFDSHFIHWGHFTGLAASGTVTFSDLIAAVIYSDLLLDVSDATFGASGTVYPTLQVLRGLDPQSFVSVSGNTLTFNFVPVPGAVEVEQVRVLTRPIPAPGSLTLLGLGGAAVLRRRR